MSKENYLSILDDLPLIKNDVDLSINNLVEAFFKIKEYQDEIEKAKNLWELTFNSVDVGLAILNEDSLIVNANSYFCYITGASKERIIGKSVCKVFCGVDDPSFSPCKNCCEQEYVYKNDKLYKIHMNALKEEINVSRCIFVAYDITEENKIQCHISNLMSKYMAVFKTVRDPLILVDQESEVIEEVNPAFVNVYGYKRSIGNEFLKLVSVDKFKSLKEVDQCVPLTFHKKANGLIFPVEMKISKAQDFYVITTRDLSDKLSSEILKSLQEFFRR